MSVRAVESLEEWELPDFSITKMSRIVLKTMGVARSFLQVAFETPPALKDFFKRARLLQVSELFSTLKQPFLVRDQGFDLLLAISELYFYAIDLLEGAESFLPFKCLPSFTTPFSNFLGVTTLFHFSKILSDYYKHLSEAPLVPFLDEAHADSYFKALHDKEFELWKGGFAVGSFVLGQLALVVPGGQSLLVLSAVAKGIGGTLYLSRAFS